MGMVGTCLLYVDSSWRTAQDFYNANHRWYLDSSVSYRTLSLQNLGLSIGGRLGR